MKKMKQRIIAFLLSVVMVITACPVSAEAAGTPATVNEEQVRARVLDLAQKLGINVTSLDQNGDGVYFTQNGKSDSCSSTSSTCDNCFNGNVITADWFKAKFGTISSNSLFPRHYSAYSDGGTISYSAWQCAGFAAFALWYIAKEDNTSNINRVYLGSKQIQTFSLQNLKASDIRVGDVIRINLAGTDKKPHSMMFISMNETAGTIKVLDCNYGSPCQVRIHDVVMKDYTGYNMAITRVSNYEPGEKTPSGDVSGGTDYKNAISVKAKSYGEYTRTSFLNKGFSDIPDQWCVWFVKHCADQVGAGQLFSSSNLTTTFYEEMTNPNGKYKATGVYFDEGKIKDFTCFKYASKVDRNTYTPQKGDIICLIWNGTNYVSIGHMGLVTDYDASTKKISFVDGNTRSSDTESLRVKVRDGNSYEKFSLTNAQIVGYIRPNYAALEAKKDVVTLNTSEIKNWEVGKEGPFKAYVNGVQVDRTTMTWGSSNTAVATCVNGKLVGKSAGTTTITCTKANGTTATCKVTVVGKDVVTLNTSEIKNWEVGKEGPFKAYVNGVQVDRTTMTWSSSNTAVATCVNGKLVGKSAGTTTITCTKANGTTATCKVTVVGKDVVTLNTSEIKNWEVGKEGPFKAYVNGVQVDRTTMTWSSSNTAVATCVNGKLVGKSAGTVTITCTKANGTTATCKVTVVGGQDVVTLNSSEIKNWEVGKEGPFKVYVNGVQVDRTTMTWSSSNTAVATCVNGKLVGKSAGTTVISCTKKNGTTATCKVTVR